MKFTETINSILMEHLPYMIEMNGILAQNTV